MSVPPQKNEKTSFGITKRSLNFTFIIGNPTSIGFPVRIVALRPRLSLSLLFSIIYLCYYIMEEKSICVEMLMEV